MAFNLTIVEVSNKKRKNLSVFLVAKSGNWCVMHAVTNSHVISVIRANIIPNVKRNSIIILLTCNNWHKRNRILVREVEKKEKITRSVKDVLKNFKKGSFVNSVNLSFVFNVRMWYILLENLWIINDWKLFLFPKIIKK